MNKKYNIVLLLLFIVYLFGYFSISKTLIPIMCVIQVFWIENIFRVRNRIIQIGEIIIIVASMILFIDSILVVDGKFHYEGVLSQKPFLAYLSSARTGRNMLDLGLYFIVEPGNIHIRIANWADEGVVSGTPINEDYSTYMIGTKRSMENQLLFLEKYAQYPDVVRFHLSFLLNGRRMSRDPNFPKYLQILDRMPKADRDILLAWLDYTIKKYE